MSSVQMLKLQVLAIVPCCAAQVLHGECISLTFLHNRVVEPNLFNDRETRHLAERETPGRWSTMRSTMLRCGSTSSSTWQQQLQQTAATTLLLLVALLLLVLEVTMQLLLLLPLLLHSAATG
jgi:hypothetical protein